MPHAKKRKIWARIWLGLVFLLVTAAHYFFYRFSFDHLNNYPVSRGLTFGCVLWTTVLLCSMWLRYAWARYVMITMLCLGIFGFISLAMMVRTESVSSLPQLMKLVVYGVLLYAAALIPLGISHSLRHYLGPRTAGDR